MLQLLYLPILAAILLIYFKIANRFNIIDKPNERSSHTKVTIRGGGIIFPIAFIIHFSVSGFEQAYFMLGLFIISLVSFMDDIGPLSNKTRILCHLIAVTLLFYQAELFNFPIWILAVAYVIVIGTINAYNFMDGINGITGSYSLITVGTIWYVNQNEFFILDEKWFIMTFLTLLVFLFYNFRCSAKCFLGDVGSVSLAFVLIFFLLLLVIETKDIKYIGFLLLYGLDSISTIVFRLFRGENIFLAHRSHFYQYLANSKKWPHLAVALLYMFLQAMVNIFLISTSMDWVQVFLFFVTAGALFVGIRYLVEGQDALLGKSDSYSISPVSRE